VNDKKRLTEEAQLLKKKQIIGLVSLSLAIGLFIMLTILIGRPLLQSVRDGTSFRLWMQERGFLKYPIMIGIMVLQVLVALIPGEPIEFAAGYIFGAFSGTVLCLIGGALGSLIIILLVRKYGMKLIRLFFDERHIVSIKFLENPKKRDETIFLLFLIPGTPKDLLTYLAGLVPINLGRFLILTTIARIPSVLSSTLAGSMLEQNRFRLTLIIYGITLAVTIIGALIYKAYQQRQSDQAKYKDLGSKPNEEAPGEEKERTDV
jgi:uncharacterized membrane protein YdjX (TVP38/TMEM64 family)